MPLAVCFGFAPSWLDEMMKTVGFSILVCFRNDDLATPQVRTLAAAVEAGLASEAWLEEQLRVLMQRLLERRPALDRCIGTLPVARAASRREL